VPEGGSGELGNGGAGWHQGLDEVFCEGVGQCLQAQGHEPEADALARRASAKQWAEAQLEEEIAALLRKAKAELEAEAAADHARQRQRKARCTALSGRLRKHRPVRTRRRLKLRPPRSEPTPPPPAGLERRDNGPRPPRRWPCRRPRRLVSGLQLPGGGRWSPPGDRGGGDQQPGQ
jgi:hypothetical protein